MCIKKSLIIVLFTIIYVMNLSACKASDSSAHNENSVSNIAVDDIVQVTIDDEGEPENFYLGFDLDELGVNPYSYAGSSDEFQLSGNLQNAIVYLYALYGDWDSSDVNDECWQDLFIDSYILNSWYTPDYLNDKSVVTIEEAEYVQYSLTGERLYFDGDEQLSFDRSRCSSPFIHRYMYSYSAMKVDDGYTVNAIIISNMETCNVTGEVIVEPVAVYTEISIAENPYSCFDGYSVKDIKVIDTLDEPWRQAYLEFLNSDDPIIQSCYSDPDITFSLIYLDDDNVPELFIDTGFEAGGQFVVTYYNGTINSLHLSRRGSQYIEKNGLIYTNTGHMDYYPLSITELKDGVFTVIGSGVSYLSEEDRDKMLEDEDYPYTLTYEWEGEIVTETQYNEKIYALYDLKESKYLEGGYSYGDIFTIISIFQ